MDFQRRRAKVLNDGRGRPTLYTPEIAKIICERLADIASLRKVCEDPALPSESTVRTWALEDREGFSAQYARAREIGYQGIADEILDIADDSSGDVQTDEDGNARMNAEFVGRSRLRVDTRKWLLSKALPKIYGDKVALTGDGGGPVRMEVTEIALTSPANAGRD